MISYPMLVSAVKASLANSSRRFDPINYANDFGARTLVFESWRFSVEKHHEFVQTRYADRAEPIGS